MPTWAPGINPWKAAPLPRMTRPAITMVTNFQSGHGWTLTGGASSNANDTTDYVLGTQSVSVTTNGSGGAFSVRKTGLTSADLTGRHFVVWAKVDDPTKLLSLILYVGDTSLTNFYTMNVASTATQSPFVANAWTPVVFSFAGASSTGAPNIAAVTDWQLRVQDTSTGAITVHLGGIGHFAKPTAFPNGVVSVTFDDANLTCYTEGRKKMDQYGYAGTHYTLVEQVGGSNITLAQLTSLQDEHGWDIGGHAYALASHNAPFTGLSADALEADLYALKNWLTSNGFAGRHLAYPSGSYNAAVASAVSRYFATATYVGGSNRQVPWTQTPMQIGRYAIDSNTTTLALTNAIDAAYSNGQWLILMFHGLVAAGATSDNYLISDFGTVIDYLNTKGIPVRTVDEVWRTMCAQA